MNILGISAFYHDSAACLVQDGRIVAAVQEERFTRKKHDHCLPTNAIDFCLKSGEITPQQLDYVAFYDKPLRKFERLLETYLSFAPRGFRSFLEAMPLWLKEKLFVPRQLDKALGGQYRKGYVFCEHHESHAASAFFPSPFDQAAILTLDGVGEWATATFGVGRANHIELTDEVRFPHSLGLLYSAFTYFTGFRVNSGEYKLMGLAPFGEPVYKQKILDHLIDLKPDGSFRLNMDYFTYPYALRMTGRKFADLFDGPPRQPESRITQREMDLAASVQAVTEEAVLRAARHVRKTTDMRDLVLAGGVALNCVANGRIVREGIFDNIWIQPAAGDAGGALGAALFVWHQLLGNQRQPDGAHDVQRGSLIGPRFTTEVIEKALTDQGAVFERIESEDKLLETVARQLDQQKIVGMFHGSMEFGPRALGNRSILGDPRSEKMQRFINLKIKFRESFRPFAPVVLADRVHAYFDVPAGLESPYMLLVAPVHPEKLRDDNAPTAADDLTGRINQIRSDVPAVTHVDNSARLQTIDPDRHGRFHRLLARFYELTGCPVLINTSFNVRGEPIVCSPADAYRCFMATDMDVLVMEDCILFKDSQPNATRPDLDSYLNTFELD